MYVNPESSLRELHRMFFEYTDARIILLGHSHDTNSQLFHKTFIGRDGGKPKKCLIARMGSYLLSKVEGSSTYAERRHYRSLVPGFFRFYIAPYGEKIETNLEEIIGR